MSVAPTSYLGPTSGKVEHPPLGGTTRSPMSRTGLHRPRRTRTASPPPGPRHAPPPFTLSTSILHPNTHNKRCPKAQRLDLRSDLSPPRPTNGRSPDKSRQALFKGNCQVSAPPIGRNGFAPSGDAKEHGVKLLHWAIEPFSDSTVVTIGKLRSTNAGHGSPLPSLRVVEHFRWARLPQSESFSRLVHTLSEVWGKDSTVVTTRRTSDYERRSRVSAPIPQGGRALPVVETAPEREFLASRPYPIGSMGLSQSRRRSVRPSPGRTPRIGTGVADFRCTNRPGTFHVPSIPNSEVLPVQSRFLKGPSPGADTPHRLQASPTSMHPP